MEYKYYAEIEFDNAFGSYGNGHTQKEAIDNCKFYVVKDYPLKQGAKIVGELFKRKPKKEKSKLEFDKRGRRTNLDFVKEFSFVVSEPDTKKYKVDKWGIM